ncbi:hypothetical protein Q8F55_003896 [Vanrija albida]|uniref:Sodium/calcium exchanger membrane region domain-containing protein n=1 Tax=Vanrija albida TaxID=181172 RepID=A0ABR3Q607_9TREE
MVAMRSEPRRRQTSWPHRALALAVVLAALGLYSAVALPRLHARKLEHRHAHHAHLKRSFGALEEGEPSRGTLLRIPYEVWWDETPAALRPAFLALLVLILAVLFSSISITASDFFCPNLATLSAYLGLSETTAGVTLLAFGNGSPDVFSTFVAVREGTLGLAVGELIGAASFITSIVVGSIAMVKPFNVPRLPFVRDAVFFVAAVLTLMWVLKDGHLSLRESGGMVLVYVAYVFAVVISNYIVGRRRRRRELEELGWKASTEVERAPSPIEQPEPVQPSSLAAPVVVETPSTPQLNDSLALRSSPTRVTHLRRVSAATLNSDQHVHHHAHHHDADNVDTPRATFSLLGAVEFRDVVNSLRQEIHSPSSSRPPSRPGSPGLDDDEGHHHHHRRHLSSGPTLSPTAALSRRQSLTGQRSRSGSLVRTPLSRSSSGRGPARPRSPSLSDSPAVRALEAIPPSPEQEPAVVSGSPSPRRGSIASRRGSLGSRRGSLASKQPSGTDLPSLAPADTSSSATLAGSQQRAARKVPDLPNLIIPGTDTPRKPFLTSHIDDAESPGLDLPAIAIVDPSGESHPPPISRSNTHESVFVQAHTAFYRIMHTLFPSLIQFREKSILGKVLAILSVPAIFCLTLTLPVVDDGRGGDGGIALPIEDEPLTDHTNALPLVEQDDYTPVDGDEYDDDDDADVRSFQHLHSHLHLHRRASISPIALVQSSSPGFDDDASDTLSAIADDLSDCDGVEYNPYLTAAQCVLGPVVCTYLLFLEEDYLRWALAVAGGIGVGIALVTLKHSTDGTEQPWRLIRCCSGFVCSMIWIASIADEVVAVLQTVGEIFGLSDAIIGLTIFAVGNSLADLVANVTIAQFAPTMAYAACFGGPLLNLLLGIGGAGSFSILSSPTHAPVLINFSPTLWVSGCGLLFILIATAIVVPINRFRIDRRWAACLLVAYAAIMTTNVVVEIRHERK